MTKSFTPDQDQYLQLAQSKAYYEGLREGVRMYAHWKDGVQYVGTTGRTLDDAIASIDQTEKTLLSKFDSILKL